MELLFSGWFWVGFVGVLGQMISAALEWRKEGLLPDTYSSFIKYITSHQMTITLSVICYIGVEACKFAMGAQMDGYCIIDGYVSQEVFNRYVMKAKDWHNTTKPIAQEQTTEPQA